MYILYLIFQENINYFKIPTNNYSKGTNLGTFDIFSDSFLT
jgi:hypothetical protein